MEKFDLAVLGAGPGGYTAAIRAAQLGLKTVLVEREHLGGTCLNRGCIPTKYLADLAHLVEKAGRSAARGVTFGKPEVHMSRVVKGKNRVVAVLRSGIGHLLKSNGVTVIEGEGTLLPDGGLKVAGRKIAAGRVILATGSRAARPKALPFDSDRYITSDELLDLETLPETLAVVGGGFIGCEFASIFAAFGCRVAIYEMLPRLMPLEDPDISAVLERSFKKRGISVTVGRAAPRAELEQSGLVLVAVGREPNTGGIGLREAGVAVDGAGFVKTGDNLETAAPGIFAIGDIAGKGQLAYLASAQGISVAGGLKGGRAPAVPYHLSPNCVFTSPEIGTFGLGEQDIRDNPGDYQVGVFPFSALGKAHCINETEGFVKIIAERKTGRLAGCRVIGPGAADLVHIASLVAAAEGTVETLGEAIFGHPTLAESVKEAAAAALGRAIHLPRA